MLLSLLFNICIPNFLFNLLSVSEVIKTLNCSITFSPNSYVFQDLGIKRMIGSYDEKDGLYYLDLGEPPSSVLSVTAPLFNDILLRLSIFGEVALSYTHVGICV